MLFLKNKIVFCVLGVAHGDPIFAKFGQIFFRTTGFQLKFLILIKLPNILHWKPAKKIKLGVVLGQNLSQIISNVVKKVYKETGNFIRFFSYLTCGLPFKARSSGCKTT